MLNLEPYLNNRPILTSRMLKQKGLYPYFRKIQTSDGSCVQVNNRQQVMIGSNNYLGLTHHPYVIEKTQQAVSAYGTGCTGSRFLNGNLEIHEQLEERLARFVGKEDALVFATGMQVNLGSLSALCGPRDCLLSDSENHASIIDATRMAKGTTYKFKHNNMADLEDLLTRYRNRYRQAIIVSDGVFSMTGDLMKLKEINDLAQRFDALVYLDDAHGTGVLGKRGRGTANFFHETERTHLIMGTFSKSFASVGGFVAGSKELIDFLRHSARSFMFSAAMPPSAVATVSACLDLIEETDEIHQQLWENVEFMRQGFRDLGFYTYNSQTPIIPILVEDDVKAMEVTRFLDENGVFATPVISPAVPAGEALIRTSYMASHRREDLQYVLDVFEKVARQFPLPSEKKIQ